MFFRETLRGIPLPDPASAAPPGRTPPAPYPPLCRMALRLSGLRDPPVSPYTQARQAQRRRAMTTGTALLLCRAAAHALPGIRFVRPAVNLFTIVAETAGADGLKIAETFPEGRGSPHGCGLRAVFCTDAASARPEACRDKSKGPRSGDFAGRSPGAQGAAATGRPLCAPCAMPGITQKINRERNVR